jgi:hypothetical protein
MSFIHHFFPDARAVKWTAELEAALAGSLLHIPSTAYGGASGVIFCREFLLIDFIYQHQHSPWPGFTRTAFGILSPKKSPALSISSALFSGTRCSCRAMTAVRGW